MIFFIQILVLAEKKWFTTTIVNPNKNPKKIPKIEINNLLGLNFSSEIRGESIVLKM